MSTLGRIKSFYKFWLEPPGLRKWREKLLQPRQQKFWNGEDAEAPLLEKQYFEALGLGARTITRRDDSRICALVSSKTAFPLPRLGPGDSVQFAVAADKWAPTSTLECSCGGAAAVHTGLREGRWLDIRLEPQGEATSFSVQASQPLWVSYPRIVRKRRAAAGAAKGARHVVVMVLDGYARRRFPGEHPTEPARSLTPNLDRFFAEGYEAPNGFSSSEWTLPTTASFFTGLYASRHGMVHPTQPMKYKPNQKLLAERFQQEGFHTLGLSCGNRLTPAFGSNRGFDRFIYHWAHEGRTTFDYDPAVWISEVIGHLDSHRDDATFTYIHFPDTHPAWNLAPINRSFNLARRGASTGHDLDALENSALGAEQGRQILLLRLHEFDRAIEALFRYIELNCPEDTLVVLTADHGTPWPDFHDAFGKATPSLNELRIGTFIRMKGPGVPKRLCLDPVSPNLDLMPTLLSLAGIERPAGLDGADLLDAGTSRSEVISESIYRGIYEVAVNSVRRQWIRRFPFDDQAFRITGPAFYGAGFPAGATDYTQAAFKEDEAADRLIESHLRTIGLSADVGK